MSIVGRQQYVDEEHGGRLARAQGYPRLMVSGYGCPDAPPGETRPRALILRAISAQSPPVQYIYHRAQLPGVASLRARRAGPYGTSSQVQLPGFRYMAEVPWDPFSHGSNWCVPGTISHIRAAMRKPSASISPQWKIGITGGQSSSIAVYALAQAGEGIPPVYTIRPSRAADN